MKYFASAALACCVFLSSCATILHDKNTLVTFQVDKYEVVEVKTPYGTTFLKEGNGVLMIPNQQKDIPIQIKCRPDAMFVPATLPTHYDLIAGGLGNAGLLLLWIAPGIIGFLIDGLGNKAYVPETPFVVTRYCDSVQKKVSLPFQTKGSPAL